MARWLKLLKEGKVVPFDASSVGLDAHQLTMLQELRIIFEGYTGSRWRTQAVLPEIYRTGLGFETFGDGRPRTDRH